MLCTIPSIIVIMIIIIQLRQSRRPRSDRVIWAGAKVSRVRQAQSVGGSAKGRVHYYFSSISP